MTGHYGFPGNAWVRECPTCGKRSFPTRRAAKQAARAWFPNEALRAYQCGDSWHIGHTPRSVKRGEKGTK